MKRGGFIKRATPLRNKRPEPPREEFPPLEYPKPSQVKKAPVAVRIMKDGREVVNLLCKEGRDIYMDRIEEMRLRQGKRCCLEKHDPDCSGFLSKADATFEHQDGRGQGGGHRDDRIWLPDPKTGELKPYNGAAHTLCNSRKASVRVNYNEVP